MLDNYRSVKDISLSRISIRTDLPTAQSSVGKGNPHLPWEKEAYDKTDDYDSL